MIASNNASDGDSVDSSLSWVDNDEIEVSQTCSVDGISTPDQNDSQVENMSAMPTDLDKKEKQSKKQTNNA